MNNTRDRHYQRVTINNQTNNNHNKNNKNKKNGTLKSGRRAIAPPKLIVTRSRTPPTDTAHQSHIDVVDHRRSTRQTGSCVQTDCMATKQLSPTFPTSSSSSALSAGGVGSSFATFRCHSNPTSPNYLHPTCFNFANSGGGTFGPSPRLSRRRPGSASRFGRHSSNGSLPQSPPNPNANNNHSFAFNLSLTAAAAATTTTPSSSSPQLARSAASAHKTDINVLASIPLLPTKTATSETSEQKLTTTMRNRNKLAMRHLPERPEYSVVHYSAKGKQQQNQQQQQQQTGLRTMSSPPGGATDEDDDDDDDDEEEDGDRRTSTDVAVTIEDSAARHLKRTIDADMNEEDIKSQENITLNLKSERSRPPSSAGRSHRASWVLHQQQSYSIESVDSNPGPFQDFGIRDYLNMTGESIDNEEESSLAGDFNIGLGVRPPRFSIDSLIDAFTMSHLLEMDETNDKLTGLQLSPSSSGIGSTSTGLPLSPSSPSPRSAARRRCSDETGLLSRKTNKYQPELNCDARNHGGIGAAANRTHGIMMSSMTSHPSGRFLRKCNSLPHSCLPKINEGGPSVQADLRGGANVGSDTKARDLMKVSREAGTIEEMDDCDWEFDERTHEDNPETSKEPE